MSEPAVSFVIPVRNDRERLGRCVTSVLADAERRLVPEVIVVDNGSADGSGDLARSLGATVLDLPGIGVAALRNRGAAVARAGLVAFVDADHELGRGWVRAAVEVMQDPGIGAAGALCVPPPRATWAQLTYGALRGSTVGHGDVEWLGSGNLLVRKRAFESVGGFDETLVASEDVDLCRRLTKAGWRLVADERFKNIHYGDPDTLTRLFRSELWRGRNNLAVSLRSGLTLRSLPGALFPIVQLAGLLLVVAALAVRWTGWTWSAGIGGSMLALTLAARTAVIVARGKNRTPRFLLQALAVAAAYDGARALALVWPARHHRR